jgi:hypothetical protein
VSPDGYSDIEHHQTVRGYTRYLKKGRVINPFVNLDFPLPHSNHKVITFVCDLQSGYAETYLLLRLAVEIARHRSKGSFFNFVLTHSNRLLFNSEEFHARAIESLESKQQLNLISEERRLLRIDSDSISIEGRQEAIPYDLLYVNQPLSPEPNMGLLTQASYPNVRWLDEYALGPLNFKEWKLKLALSNCLVSPYITTLDPKLIELLADTEVRRVVPGTEITLPLYFHPPPSQ